MAIRITNGKIRRRNADDDIDEDEAWKDIEFDYYAEGPGKEGDPNNESAIRVAVDRGEVKIQEWSFRDFRDEDPDSEPEWGLQEVTIDLDDLFAAHARWKGTSGGDDRSTTLEDVVAMTPARQQEAIIRRALSRIGYGPNDESIVRGIGDDRERYNNNPRKSKGRLRKRNSVATFSLSELANVGVVLGGLGASRADQMEIWQDLAKFSVATAKASQAQYGARSGAEAYTATQIRQAAERDPTAGDSIPRARDSVSLFEYNVYDNGGQNYATQWEMQAIQRLEDRMARLTKRKTNPRSAPDKYGDRTGYHMSLTYGQLPSKAKFKEIWADEMGDKRYPWDLKGKDRFIMQTAVESDDLDGVTSSGVADADSMYAFLKALVDMGWGEDSEDTPANFDLASGILHTLGIEWV